MSKLTAAGREARKAAREAERQAKAEALQAEALQAAIARAQSALPPPPSWERLTS